MTIATTANRKSFAGNGVTTVFTFPYYFLADGDLVVLLVNDATGVSVTQVITTNYTVSGAGDPAGGDVTMLVAPASGETLVIYRDPAKTQGLDLVENDNLPSAELEKALDRGTMLIQRLADLQNRSLRQPDGDASNITVLPPKIDRASQLLGFNADGDPIASAGTGGVATSPFMATVVDDLTAADAAATLGVSNVVASITALKAEVLLTSGRTVYLSQDGRIGFFKFNTADLSTEVTADTQNGVYVPPDSDNTGASGAWVRQYNGKLNIKWFGATGDGTTNDTTSVQAALNFAHANTLGELHAPAGTYSVTDIDWPGNNITLSGEGSGYSYNTSATPRTIFKARTGTTTVFDLVQTGLAEDRTGNHLVDIAIDGNSIAAKGFNCAGSNILERCQVKGCTTAGVNLANFTNGTRLVRCGINSNSGYGVQVTGASTTTLSIIECNISLNTTGGIDFQAGVLVDVQNCVVESNTGPGLRMYKPNAHTNVFGGFNFHNTWFEDNGSASPYFTLVFDAETSSPTYGAQRVKFSKCRINPSSATRKHMNCNVVKWLVFDECQFDSSTDSAALTLSSNAHHVAWINSAEATGFVGLSATQLDNAIAQGFRCYSSDKAIKRNVNAGAPAAAFENSWVNYGGGLVTAKYWFDEDGNVHIEGAVKSGATASSTIFTLPVGYRPTEQYSFAVDGNAGHALLYVNTNGTVLINSGGSTSFQSLNGVIFPTG